VVYQQKIDVSDIFVSLLLACQSVGSKKKDGGAYSKWGRCLYYLYPKRFCTIDFLQPDPGCPCDEESKKGHGCDLD
jgi:hypothetical protein